MVDFIVDTFTRVPSEMLVKSASSFGEEAAKQIGSNLEDGFKSVSYDISKAVRDAANEVTGAVKVQLAGFVDKFKETGVEAFTEWGICIERAFLHLGQKIEVGISNFGNRVSAGIHDSIDDSFTKLSSSIVTSTDKVTQEVGQLGMKQTDHIKKVFAREITILTFSVLLCSISLFILSLSYMSNIGIMDLVAREFKSIMFLGFAVFNGYAIHVWNSKFVSLDAGGSVSTNKNTIIPGAPQLPRHALENPRMLFIVVAGVGFLAGNISTEILYFKSLNTIVAFAVMCIVTLVVYKALVFDLLYKIYKFYLSVREFIEWRQKKKAKQSKKQPKHEQTSPLPATSANNQAVVDEREVQKPKTETEPSLLKTDTAGVEASSNLGEDDDEFSEDLRSLTDESDKQDNEDEDRLISPKSSAETSPAMAAAGQEDGEMAALTTPLSSTSNATDSVFNKHEESAVQHPLS